MNRKPFLLFLLPVLLFLSYGEAEENIESNIVPGKMIIQFKISEGQSHFVESLENTYSFANIKAVKCLSYHLGIWLMSYDTDKSADRMLLKQLRRDPCIASAQFEHYITIRELIPNDPEFDNQWALRNTGQTGGLPDADIDASLAWDVSVNTGASVLGDTIVMAIVDDGFSLGHDDMNYWKNRNEIPNNGIDEDNNGYIDDYNGWNAYYSSGYIQPADHGQHVAGIAGAIGNNNLGVCGVNWNGRVMCVAGSSEVESTVVEAYAYVYQMRWQYDQTSGLKGAFVVVTNSSFGIDYGDPEDYPVWGAMYDSLGSLGILSVAATTNGPWNVDLLGDVPTTFSTDFLISVTNTTKDDEKNLGAGWGPVSIDLGAPGRGIISTRIPNTYGYKSGTSMATPQVTGSIALMFSAADEAFMHRYEEEPELIALFLKNLLLDGVDTLSGFDTLCVSAGRLNVNNAIQKLINPRIGIPMDTLKVNIAPDSIKSDTVSISNLLGFELPYESEIQNIPTWISHNTLSGLFQAHATEEMIFSFDATGLSIGTYICEMVFTDIAGMQNSLIIELEVSDPQGLTEGNTRGEKIYCFPNPFSSNLNISISLDEPAPVQLLVYSMNGELIRHWSITDNSRELMIKWDGTDLWNRDVPQGVYIIQLKGTGVKEIMRVIKTGG